jgi:Flp pilus assembly protein TadB
VKAKGSPSPRRGEKERPTSSQRRALGALFFLLGCGFAGVAYAAAHGAGGSVGRWVIVLAAAVLALWLVAMAFRALR